MLSVFKMFSDLAFQVQWDTLLCFLPLHSPSFLLSHWQCVTVDEMQMVKYWQLSGGRCLDSNPLVLGKVFPLSRAEAAVERILLTFRCPSCFPGDRSAKGSTTHCVPVFQSSW